MPREVPKDGFSMATIRVIRAGFNEIRARDGVVTSKGILAYASKPNSPLHRFFEWDNSAAAEKYRLHQASELMRRVQVYVQHGGTKEPTRVYLNVKRDDIRQYLPADEAYSDEDTAQQFMLEMRRELEGLLRRYKMHDFCAKSIGLIERAIEALAE